MPEAVPSARGLEPGSAFGFPTLLHTAVAGFGDLLSPCGVSRFSLSDVFVGVCFV